MKKILTLLVVLAVANLATAAISWEVADNGDGTFAVSLVADENVSSVSLALLTPSAGSIAVGTLNAGFTSYYDNGYTGASQGAPEGTLVAVSGSQSPTFVIGTLYTFTFTGSVGDTITVGDYPDWFMTSVVHTQNNGVITLTGNAELGTINIVPEPMTMALLGLGGLFIRRRRA